MQPTPFSALKPGGATNDSPLARNPHGGCFLKLRLLLSFTFAVMPCGSDEFYICDLLFESKLSCDL